MIFSKRHKLAKEFEEWAKERNISNCALNVIAFLDIKGYNLTDIRQELNEYETDIYHFPESPYKIDDEKYRFFKKTIEKINDSIDMKIVDFLKEQNDTLNA
jgi:hypothetical protein